MACVISAPKSGSGKTILSLIITAWAYYQKKNIQTFKIGPDYLDAQQLSAIAQIPCRNLDPILCGEEWVRNSFHHHGSLADFSLIEGVMGLFDGVGSSSKGSTAEVAKILGLPIILIVDIQGQAASLGALIKGFKEMDKDIHIAGVILNQVKTSRHKHLLEEVLSRIGIKVLGALPYSPKLTLTSKNLGLAPAHEITNLSSKISTWHSIANSHLNMKILKNLLEPPKPARNPIKAISLSKKQSVYPIAIADDKAFHFNYPETKECLEAMGMPVIPWKLIEDQPIPKEAKGLIIPGGFPEEYAEQISTSQRSLSGIQSFFGKIPIYAECGGMLVLGQSLTDLNNKEHSMAGVLPFVAKKGPLRIGYRKIKSISNSLILSDKDYLIGHEFHRWELNSMKSNERIKCPWEIDGWEIKPHEEGWCNNLIHASWIHLHWPSSPSILNQWKKAIMRNNDNF